MKVYPQRLCINCKHRLDKIKKDSTNLVQDAPACFEPHSDADCSICNINIAKHRKLSNAHIKLFDKEFSKHQLCRYNQGASRDLIYYKPVVSKSKVYVPLTLTIRDDLTWSVCVNEGVEISSTHECFRNLPQNLNDGNIGLFAEKFSTFKTCSGNQDFEGLLERRIDFKESFPNKEGGKAAWVESSNGHVKLEKKNFDTIRSVACTYIVQERELCENCIGYRKKLSKYNARSLEAEANKSLATSASSTTNLKHLTVAELRERLANVQISRQQEMQRTAAMALKIRQVVEEDSVTSHNINKSDHDLFKTILKEKMPQFEQGSPQWLLWNQQLEQASKKDSRTMRWHPLIIRWCLSIYLVSPAAYRQMASKGNKFIVLPHVSTLKKYINYTEPTSGFNPDVIEQFVLDSRLATLKEFEKNVSLSFDEIKIKSGLVYKKGTGKIIGFTDMGDVNDEIKTLMNRFEEKGENHDFARYINVFFVRGIFSKLCSPIGYHSSMGFTGDQLFPLVWEATRILEGLGLKVRSWTCDGATPN